MNTDETMVIGNSQNANPNKPQVATVVAKEANKPAPKAAIKSKTNDGGQTWKRVAIGGVTGILMGTVGAAAATTAYQHFNNNEENDTNDTEGGSHTLENGLQVAEVDDSMSFSEAFNAAREEVGPGGVFHWHGGVYNTYSADEWSNMSVEERREFAEQVAPEVEPTEPVAHTTQAAPAQPAAADVDVDVTDQPADDTDVVEVTVEDDVTPAATTTAEEADVQIVGVEEISFADGTTGTIATASVEGHEVYLVDVDNNGVFDVAAVDANGNGSIEQDEMFDISDHNITVNDLAGTTPTATDDGMTAYNTGYDDAGMPDYANDVTGDVLV